MIRMDIQGKYGQKVIGGNMHEKYNDHDYIQHTKTRCLEVSYGKKRHYVTRGTKRHDPKTLWKYVPQATRKYIDDKVSREREGNNAFYLPCCLKWEREIETKKQEREKNIMGKSSAL